MNTALGAPAPHMPINSALTTALDQLQRCESLARSIRASIHGEVPTPSSSADKPYQAMNTSPLSNTLSNRLQELGNALEEISSSF